MIGAVDIGGTKISVAVVDPLGLIIERRSTPTNGEPAPDRCVARVIEMLRDCERAANLSISGIGIGCTGPVDAVGGIVGDVDFLPGWRGFALREAFAHASGVDAALENDADAGALAEWRWGAGRDASRFVYVSVGTGIGIGIVINGEIYRGAMGIHPEFGHHTIDDDGPECYCGARGCWEVLASGRALERWVAKSGQITAGYGTLDARAVVEAAQAGQPIEAAALDRQAKYLGIGLSNVALAFAPDVIALGGGMMAAWSTLSKRALSVAGGRSRLIDFSAIRVERTFLGDDAPLLGAAQAYIRQKAGKSGARRW